MTEVRPGYISDGNGNWIQIGPSIPVGSTVYYQATEPSTPQTGDIWIDSDNNVPSIDNSQFLRWRKTVSGGETSLSGLDDSGLSLQYTPAYEQVYLNGVLLVRGQDYAATTGTSITGLTALAASDIVEVFSVVARVVGDVYTQSQTNSLLDAKSNVSTTGLVLLNTTPFTTATNVVLDNIFTDSYTNYKIQLVTTTNVGNGQLYFELRSAGSNIQTNYIYNVLRSYGTTINSYAGSTTQIAPVGQFYNSPYIFDMDIFNPKTTNKTGFVFNGFIEDAADKMQQRGSGYQNSTTSIDGIRAVYPGTSMTGTIKIYGYK